MHAGASISDGANRAVSGCAVKRIMLFCPAEQMEVDDGGIYLH
jgi:hypothetical protein